MSVGRPLSELDPCHEHERHLHRRNEVRRDTLRCRELKNHDAEAYA